MAKTKPAPDANKDDPYAGISRQEKSFVGNLLKEIDRAKTNNKKFNQEKLPALRKLAAGDVATAGDSRTRTNMIYATMATLMPLIYAKNPQIGVTLTDSVAKGEQYQQWRKFSKTAQALLNKTLIGEAGLKSRSKANVRSAMSTGVGLLKMIWQESIASDPILTRRENDLQDNLRRIEYLIKETKSKVEIQGHEQKREELKQAIKAIRDNNEARIYKGLAIDRISTENFFILDDGVIEFHDYVKARRLAHLVFMDTEEFHQTFGFKCPPGITEYSSPDLGNERNTGDSNDKTRFIAVYEVWDQSQNVVYTIAEGCNRYCRAPYTPKGTPERWHGFYALGFNLLEGRWRPISDVELLEHLQKEYDDTRYLFAEARKEAIPVWVFRMGGNLTEEDIEKLSNRKARQWVGVKGNPQVPLKEDVMQFAGVAIDPAAYDVTIIRNDMDMLVGLTDASRSNLVEAKTATEAEIMRQALQNRVAERQDANEDLISEMAVAAMQIMLQKLTEDEVKQIVGEDAYWPKVMGRSDVQEGDAEAMSLDEVFNRVNIAVRAGSTGKPNLVKERENWTQLMGVINDTVTQVAELRVSGQFDLATAKVELLRETLRRFDESLDVDAFIPPQELGEDGKPVAMTNALMQAQQMQEQMAAMQEELQKCQEALQQAEQQVVALTQQHEGLKASNEVQIAEARAKEAQAMQAAAEQETARMQAEMDAQTQREENVAKAAAAEQAKVDMHEATLDAEDRRHEREMQRDEHKAMVDGAVKLVTAQMSAKAAADATAAKEGEADGEVEDAAGGFDPAQFSTMMEQMMQRLEVAVSTMAAGKTFTVKRGPDGSLSGEAKPVMSAPSSKKLN